ncbi:MAG: hypothetical protein JSS55_17195 [Proteobacteria bacterium]|nr:hypothetical protein [Pseudomonadota bacterium]
MSASVAMAAAGTAQSFAQPAPAAAPASRPGDASGCELHVWPSKGLRSVYHGFFHGGIVDGAVTGRDGYREVPAEPLSTAQQVELIRAAALQEVFPQAHYAIVIHSEPQSTVAIRQTPTRLATSSSPCYAELLLEDVFFQEDIVNGASLKTLARFRDFGAADRYARQFGAWAGTSLLAFPPKDPAGTAAGLTDLQNAFRSNLAKFAIALQKSDTRGSARTK